MKDINDTYSSQFPVKGGMKEMRETNHLMQGSQVEGTRVEPEDIIEFNEKKIQLNYLFGVAEANHRYLEFLDRRNIPHQHQSCQMGF